ncbi:MAG TPA: hypothetical protein VEL79_19000 [Vicinamibacterales bacterium]|nr:hypothetical protein [Vicinamibacterales bacterium]
MNKPFKIRGKLARPLSLEEIAAKYALKKSEVAKIRAFVITRKGTTVTKSKYRDLRYAAFRAKKAAR